MIVRSFRLSDYSEVSQLLGEVLSEQCYEDTMDAFAKQLSWDSELIMVAEKQGKVVGIIIGTIDGHNGYYYRIAVARHHQRQGIGKALIQALRKRFMIRKVRKIMVSVDEHNEPILPLYESLGYTPNDFLHDKKLKIVGE